MRKPLDAFAVGMMVVLCLLWGLQQVAVKAAAPDMGGCCETSSPRACLSFPS
jgi:hypothetical protein